MSMATRAITAVAGRRSGLAAALSSFRGGGARGLSQSSAQRRREDHQGVAGDRHDAAAQVEASLNRKNVEVVQGDDRSATLLADEAADALRSVGGAEAAEDAWVPDQETGVFVPAEEAAAASANGQPAAAGAPPSVLDQAVFVREEDMEDVERPPADMATAHAGGAK